MTRVWRLVVVLLFSALSCLAGLSPASAHVSLVWSYPADGAVLPHPPAEVALDAGELLDLEISQVIVRDALGQAQPLEGPRLARDGSVLLGGLAGGGARGQWHVDYRLVGEDGHAVTGRIDFAVGEPGTFTDDEGSSWGLWLVAGGGGLLVGTAWYLRWSTSRVLRPTPPARPRAA